jgi:serine/threonine protein kinase
MWLGSMVAIKIPLQNLAPEYYGHFLREVQLMTTLHHPNIVVFMGACITQPNICLVMEYLPRGCMYDFLREKDVISECSLYYRSWYQLVVKFATDVARGMQYLHRRCKIIQRDLKSQNLLIDEFYNVKVCDFGLSRTHDPRGNNGRRSSATYDNTLTACGTPFWTAPEVIRVEAYDHSADVYSYAIVLYECYTRSEPYTDRSAPAMEIAYHVAEQGLRPTVPEEMPKHLRELMEDCWHEKAHKRPKFQVSLPSFHPPFLPSFLRFLSSVLPSFPSFVSFCSFPSVLVFLHCFPSFPSVLFFLHVLTPFPSFLHCFLLPAFLFPGNSRTPVRYEKRVRPSSIPNA